MADKIKVLLIEDNAGDARLIQAYLESTKGHFALEKVSLLSEGISLLRRNNTDLVLLDLSLPDCVGLETFTTLHDRFPEFPIIVLTGLDDEEIATQAVRLGAQDYLYKNQIDEGKLIRAIRYSIERRKGAKLLRESEKNLSLIYDTAGDTLFQIGVEPKDTFRFLSVNNAFVETTGVPKKQIIQKIIDEVIPEPSLSLVKKNYKEAIKKKKTMRWEETTEYPTGTKTGAVTVSPAFDEKGICTHLIGSVHDITELREMEEAKRRSEARYTEKISRQLQRLSALRDIDLAISSSMEIEPVLKILLDNVTRQLAIDGSIIYLYDKEKQVLQLAQAQGIHEAKRADSELDLETSLEGQIVKKGQLLSIPHIGKGKAPIGFKKFAAAEGFVFYAGAPLKAKGEIKGILEVYHRESFTPDNEWFNFFEILTGQAAIAMQDAELVSNLRIAKSELETAYDATLSGWVSALDLRDNETEGHTQRVTDLTLDMAIACGISGKEKLGHIARGALLHDIGKIGIPDKILHKPGPLTADEWVIMKKHPVYAYEFLKSIDYLKPAIDIPRYHHEKWDGSGYPDGLKGEQIPLVARIFSIVDVWDALRSDRPYRKAWSAKKTLDHIKDQQNKHFDPAITKTFLEMIENKSDR